MSWTLLYNGTEKSLADWGLCALSRRLVSQAPDTVSFVADGEAFDADNLFAFGSTVIIKRDGVQWFYGRVTRIPRAGAPDAERMSYELAGPWWYLEKSIFQQEWRCTETGSSTLVATNKSRVILGQKLTADGYTKMTTGEQIAEALQWAISRGAPFQIGTVVPSMTVPYREVTDYTCAEIIRLMLRWSPDAVTFFDYSTALPTLHILRRDQCTPVSCPVTLGDPCEQIDITPRYDLQVPSVVLKYEQENQVDEITWTTVTVDKAPEAASGEEFDAIVMTIELQGGSTTSQKQKVTTAAISENSETWWKKKLPWLKDATDITISEGDIEPGGKYREITEGACPSWKKDSTAPATVTAKISYKLTDTNGNEQEYKDDKISCSVTATSLGTGEYSQITSAQAAEPVPAGLAQEFYSTLQVLQFEGAFTIVEEECLGAVGIGSLLNLTHGRPEWATMRAQVQQVAEDIDSGRTSVIFGPAEHLSPQDIVELLRVNRGRMPSYRLDERANGQAASKGGKVDGAAATANSDSGAAKSGMKKLVMKNDAGDILELSPDGIKLYKESGDATYLFADGSVQLMNGSNQIWLSAADVTKGYMSVQTRTDCDENDFDALVSS